MPIGIIGIILGSLFLHQNYAERRTHFDVPGFIFSALGLALLLYGISDASIDGWGSTRVLGCLVFGTLLLIIFVFVELNVASHERQPLLDIRVFANAPFTTSTIASILVTFALFGGLFILPIYLQALRGLSPFQTGLLLLPQAFASMIASVISGRLVDKIGVRAVIIPGLVALAIALWLFSSIGAHTPVWDNANLAYHTQLCIRLLFSTIVRLSSLGDPTCPITSGNGCQTTVRFVVSSLAVAIMATLIQTETSLHYAHLAERVTPFSPLGKLVPNIQALFLFHGAPASKAYATALQIVSRLVHLQATILAMQDAFRISLLLTGVAIIAAFFVRSRKTHLPLRMRQLHKVKRH